MATTTKKKSAKKGAKQSYDTLHQLLLLKLQALHDVESEIIKALPKLAKAASDPKLKQAFLDHLQETQAQEERIDTALEKLGNASKSKVTVEAIRGLSKDAEWIVKNVKDASARDAALVAAAQYVEHYEIAGYGTAITWAELMGHTEVVELLKETLREEENADVTLSALAESSLNDKVEMGMDDEVRDDD
jgi:ferritin-like metal-binding protein YciE